MSERPKLVYLLVLLWLGLSAIFFLWGIYSVVVLVQVPSWSDLGDLLPPLHFGYFMATIAWFMFSILFGIFSYETLRGRSWIWSTGLIITTIFLVVFGLMLASLIVNALMFLHIFSVAGLVTVILSLITDLGIVFCLTRPITKLYFQSRATK